jgi:hypothetical protein
MKEVEKILQSVSQFVQEGNSDTRAHGRRAVAAIAKMVNGPIEYEQLLKKALSETQVKKMLEIIEKMGPQLVYNNRSSPSMEYVLSTIESHVSRTPTKRKPTNAAPSKQFGTPIPERSMASIGTSSPLKRWQ